MSKKDTFPFVFMYKEIDIMNTYAYKGAVLYYDKVVANNWTAETTAQSEVKAASNFKNQFKSQSKMISGIGGVKLSGHITCTNI